MPWRTWPSYGQERLRLRGANKEVSKTFHVLARINKKTQPNELAFKVLFGINEGNRPAI